MFKLSALVFTLVLTLAPLSVFATTTIAPLPLQQSSQAHTSVVALSPARGGTVGNDLLRNLPTLFVLNALFQNADNGLLTPGPASIENMLILYRLFFTPVGFIQS